MEKCRTRVSNIFLCSEVLKVRAMGRQNHKHLWMGDFDMWNIRDSDTMLDGHLSVNQHR